METLLHTQDLCRHYRRGPQVVRALDGVTISIERGEFLGIIGSSGSGKTTLLNLMAGLDTPTSGLVEVESVPLSTLSRRRLAAYRARKVGMVFQSFNLIAHYTALQNVETALYFTGIHHRERRGLATAVLKHVGLSDRMNHRPADLSGGEQQRVAIARAIVKKPEILFADEPTGNLDYENARQIFSFLTALNREGLTVVLVTHNQELVREYTHRSLRMHYGRIAIPSGAAHDPS